jgi:hypothetical protein
LWQRQENIQRSQVIIAREQVNRSVAACHVQNDVPQAIVAAEVPHAPVGLSDYNRLMLRGFIERAVEAVEHPETCTVASLHLQDIVRIADR